MAIDPRYFTTPLGALVGLTLTRKLIPKEERTVLNQTAGTALGAGVGYIGGGYLNESMNIPKPSDRKAYINYLKEQYKTRGPEGAMQEPTAAELDAFAQALPDNVRVIPGMDPELGAKIRKDYLQQYLAPTRASWAKEFGWDPEVVSKLEDLGKTSNERIKSHNNPFARIKRAVGF